MGKGSSSAPSPDPQIGAAALKQAQTGEAWLGFAKESFKVSTQRQKELDALTKKVVNQQFGISKDQAAWAKLDRARYDNVFKPVENKFIKEATEYGSAANQAKAAAEAKADVQTSAAEARQTAERQAASLGISPTSGRFAGISRAGELGTALARAGAGNNARTATRDKGLALKADVANLGRGLPAQSAQATSLSLTAGNSATGNANAANGQFLASTGIMGNGFAGAQQGYAGQASTLNQQYGIQSNNWQAQMNADAQGVAGIGSAIGGMAGLIFSDEEVKHDKEPIPDGEALDAVNNMPVEAWTYDEGVADEGRHVGTYAQDFQRETGKGDGRTIPAQDAIGISMKAIQDLDKKVDKIAIAIGLGKPANSNKKPAVREKVSA